VVSNLRGDQYTLNSLYRVTTRSQGTPRSVAAFTMLKHPSFRSPQKLDTDVVLSARSKWNCPGTNGSDAK
jgi:hypothetical protein